MGTIEGKKIETLESIGTPENLHPLQISFFETGAIQCGFCTPAQILTAKALLDKNAHPTEKEVRESLADCYVPLYGLCPHSGCRHARCCQDEG